jgi:hypothetical protein
VIGFGQWMSPAVTPFGSGYSMRVGSPESPP